MLVKLLLVASVGLTSLCLYKAYNIVSSSIDKSLEQSLLKLDNKTESTQSKNTILLFSEIGENSLPIASKITALSDAGKPVFLLINSPGGSVIDGAQIVLAIQASQTPVLTVCMQMCASMAAIIHQYGTKRLMIDRSVLMFHNASGQVQGFVPQMVTRLNFLNRYVLKFDNDIAHRLGISLEQFMSLFGAPMELWLDAEDATYNKFNDGIVSLELVGFNKEQFDSEQKLSSRIITQKMGIQLSN